MTSRAEREGRADRAEQRRAPAVHERPWAVGAYLGFAAVVGLAWSAPIAAVVGGVTGAYPRSDAEIFDPGGVMLLEAARRLGAQLAAIGTAWSAITILAVPIGVVVLGFAIALLATPGRARPVWAFARAVRSFPTLAVVGLVALLADLVAGALIMIGGGALVRNSWPQPPARDIAGFALIGCALLAVVAVGVLHDLARAAAVVGPSRAHLALRAALRTVHRSPARTAWAYAWRALVGLAAVVAAAWLGIVIGTRGAPALAASAFVHQLGLALMGWMRLSWLAAAVKLVRPALMRPTAAVSSSAPPAAASADLSSAPPDASSTAISSPSPAAANPTVSSTIEGSRPPSTSSRNEPLA